MSCMAPGVRPNPDKLRLVLGAMGGGTVPGTGEPPVVARVRGTGGGGAGRPMLGIMRMEIRGRLEPGGSSPGMFTRNIGGSIGGLGAIGGGMGFAEDGGTGGA